MTREEMEAEQAAALDASISDTVWAAQLDPDSVPRIVHNGLVNVGYSYALPGSLFPDGLARLIVNKLTRLDRDGVMAQLDSISEARDGH